MDNTLRTQERRIDIGGIRFSGELVHYRHRRSAPADRSLAELLRAIAGRRINLPFFCSGDAGGSVHSSFCVAAADASGVDHVLLTLDQERTSGGLPPLSIQVERTDGVGTLSVFPHRQSLGLLGRVTGALVGADIAIHSLCTSISALSLNIDFARLEQAAAILQGVVALPEHHAPFRPDFTVCQVKRR